MLLPAGSAGTDESLVGRFGQFGAPAVNQGACDGTNWLHRCGDDCTVKNDGPAFWVDATLGKMLCNPGCPRGGHVAETGGDALRLSRSAGGALTLTWGPSCVIVNGFAVYEGVLGDWTSHVPRSCAAVSPATR